MSSKNAGVDSIEVEHKFNHPGKKDNVRNKNEKVKKRMRLPGVEPGSPAWQASILPLNH